MRNLPPLALEGAGPFLLRVIFDGAEAGQNSSGHLLRPETSSAIRSFGLGP
jgi:hypothetical protein